MGHYIDLHWEADLNAYGSRKERQAFSFKAFIPDPIATFDPMLPGEVALLVVEAEEATRILNDHPTVHSLEATARQLLRSESVASSRIEGLSVGQRNVAHALFRADSGSVTAQSVANNVRAMEEAVRLGDRIHNITVQDILTIHRILMNTPDDAPIAGIIRSTQNWIGGGDQNPRKAEFIPPPPDTVPALLDDLCEFISRDDMPAVVQAAIAHAQFETIHPFSDGNGRVGRCLIHVILRKRGLCRKFVPPVSVILAANSRDYVRGLTLYRVGEVAAWCHIFAGAMRTAAAHGTNVANHLATLQSTWRDRAGTPRSGSGASKLIEILPAYPVLTIETAAHAINSSYQVARLAIIRLERVGVLQRTRIGRDGEAWEARELFQAINAYEFDNATPVRSDVARRPSPTRGRHTPELR
jgi:Fic family protein